MNDSGTTSGGGGYATVVQVETVQHNGSNTGCGGAGATIISIIPVIRRWRWRWKRCNIGNGGTGGRRRLETEVIII